MKYVLRHGRESMGYLSFSFPFSHASGHVYIFFSFAQLILFCTMKNHVKVMEFLFVCGWKTCFCVTSSVEVSMSICGVYVILILKPLNESHKGRKQFDKAQCKTSSIYARFSKICQYMAMVGISCHRKVSYFYFPQNKNLKYFCSNK